MAQEIRPPEWVLEELYETGRHLMNARAREREHGAPTDWGRGDNPPRHEEPHIADEASRDASALADRFRTLADEFISRVEEL